MVPANDHLQAITDTVLYTDYCTREFKLPGSDCSSSADCRALCDVFFFHVHSAVLLLPTSVFCLREGCRAGCRSSGGPTAFFCLRYSFFEEL